MKNIKEEWREIKRYKGKYLISNLGNVFSKESYVPFQGRLYRKNQRILKICSKGNGYQYVTISIKGKRKNHYIHRLVAEAFIKKPKNKNIVNHKNGIKSDNRVENLEWCTMS